MMRPLPALALTVALLGAGAAAGSVVGSAASARGRDPYAQVELLVRVMAIIERDWVEPVDPAVLSDAAIAGMVDALDRHSAWLPADRWARLQEETAGSASGIGVELSLVGGVATVRHVVDGSPAQEAGVLPGDRILSVDGVEPSRAALHEGTVLRGPVGSIARVALERGGDRRTLDIPRAAVRERSVFIEPVDARTVYVRIDQFRETTGRELAAQMADLDPSVTALVLDLRDNPGGLLSAAIEVADQFLDGGPIVSTEGRGLRDAAAWTASPGGFGGDLAILINGLSASGSEIVAAALRDRGRAVLVGERTYGKGSVQTVFEHRDGSALKLTVGRYLTPSGEPVADRDGRPPDIEVPWPGSEDPRTALRAAVDALDIDDTTRDSLRAHLDALPNATQRRTRTPIPWGLPIPERVAADPQLAAALQALRVTRAR